MNTLLIVCLTALGLVAAAPQVNDFQFQDLYEESKAELYSRWQRDLLGSLLPQNIPYLAFITAFTSQGNRYCSGSLIRPSSILTSGFCLYGASRAEVSLGSVNPLTGQFGKLVVSSNTLLVPESYENNGIDDIGLIMLPSPVDLTDNINTISLPTENPTQDPSQSAILSGFGSTGILSSVTSIISRSFSLVITSEDACLSIAPNITATNICGSGNYVDLSSIGITGSPLTVGSELFAIGSYGGILSNLGSFAVLTRVSPYLGWITSQLDLYGF